MLGILNLVILFYISNRLTKASSSEMLKSKATDVVVAAAGVVDISNISKSKDGKTLLHTVDLL